LRDLLGNLSKERIFLKRETESFGLSGESPCDAEFSKENS
jgi:hypothetical protein